MSERAFIYLDCTPQSKPLSRLIPATPGDFARVAIHFPNGCVEVYASAHPDEQGRRTRGAVQVRYGPPPGASGHWTELGHLSVKGDGKLLGMIPGSVLRAERRTATEMPLEANWR